MMPSHDQDAFWGPPPVQRLEVQSGRRAPVTRLTSWMLCLAVVLVAATAAVLWGRHVQNRVQVVADDWPAGQVWVDPASSASFQVTSVTQTEQTDQGYQKSTAPTGATYLVWQLKVVGAAEAKTKLGDQFLCDFTLVGQHGEQWEADSSATPQGGKFSCSGDDFAGILTYVYLIPLDRVETVRGVQLFNTGQGQQPPILRRP